MDVDEDVSFGSDVEFDDPEEYDSDQIDSDLGLSTSIEIRRPPSFEALDEAILLKSTTSLIQETSDILNIPRPTALTLLRHFKYVIYEP